MIKKTPTLSLHQDIIVQWMYASLQSRHQRVMTGDVLSEWLLVTAVIPPLLSVSINIYY